MGSAVWGDLGMSLFGIGEGSGEELFGKKPVIPQTGDSAATAIAANQKNLPAAQALGAGINSFNQDQLLAMLRKAIPGYDEIIGKQKSILESEMKGEIPQDVADNIKRNAAVRSTYGGFGGSGMARNMTGRDLGLTSLAITDRALDAGSRWMQNMKNLSVPGQFDITSMFISPDQQFQRDLLAAGVEAAPDPEKRGYMERSMIVTSSIGSAFGGASYGGGGMGGGGTGGFGGGGGGAEAVSNPYSDGGGSGASPGSGTGMGGMGMTMFG